MLYYCFQVHQVVAMLKDVVQREATIIDWFNFCRDINYVANIF